MFVELSRYVDDRLGKGVWTELLRDTGLGTRIYEPQTPAPDEDMAWLVAYASGKIGRPLQAVLEDFGEFIAPDLLGGLYGLLIKPEWDVLDFLENTESAIHTVVRARDATASPPRLHVERQDPDSVTIIYESHRRMCSLAKGIVRGAAAHYGQPVELTELSCMLASDRRCELMVHRVA